MEADGAAVFVKKLDACETYVVLISPCIQDVYQHPSTSWKLWHYELKVKLIKFIFKTKVVFFWLLLRDCLSVLLHRLTLLQDGRCCELVKDVVFGFREGERTLHLRVCALRVARVVGGSLNTLGFFIFAFLLPPSPATHCVFLA